MSLFKYETHLHTLQASACGQISGAEQARKYKEAGYTGIIVTDHFFNGNSCVPRDLPWEERIDLFCKGYEDAKEEGDRIGLSVFFGLEANFKTTEFLIYGVDKQWLKANPDMLSWSVEEQYKKVHAAGGYVVHAHPFRMRDYISEIRLYPYAIDAVEVYNFHNHNLDYDKQAYDYARIHKKAMTAGTDAHGKEETFSGVAFDHKLTHIQDFIESIKTGKGKLLYEEW